MFSYKDPKFTNFAKPMQALQCLDVVLRSAFSRNEGVVVSY